MAAQIVGVQANQRGSPLDCPNHALRVQGRHADVAVAIDRAKQRATRDIRCVQPAPQRPHRTGGLILAVRQPLAEALAFLVGLGAMQVQNHPFVDKPYVGDGQSDQLAAAKGAREADQQDRFVLQPTAVVGHRSNHLAQCIEQDWGFALRRNPFLAPDAAHGPLDLGVFGRQRVAGLLVVVADTGQPALDGRDGIAIAQGDDVAENGFGRSWERAAAVSGTQGGEVLPIGGVVLEGMRGVAVDGVVASAGQQRIKIGSGYRGTSWVTMWVRGATVAEAVRRLLRTQWNDRR